MRNFPLKIFNLRELKFFLENTCWQLSQVKTLLSVHRYIIFLRVLRYLLVIPSWRPVNRKRLEFTFVKMYGAFSFGHNNLSNTCGRPRSVLFPTGSSMLFHNKFAPEVERKVSFLYD